MGFVDPPLPLRDLLVLVFLLEEAPTLFTLWPQRPILWALSTHNYFFKWGLQNVLEITLQGGRVRENHAA